MTEQDEKWAENYYEFLREVEGEIDIKMGLNFSLPIEKILLLREWVKSKGLETYTAKQILSIYA